MPPTPPQADNDTPSEAAQPPASEPAFLALGRITRPHGVRGELRLQILTDYPERITHLETVYIGPSTKDRDSAAAYGMISARKHREQMIVKLEGLTDRDDAELLRGQLLMVTLDDAVPLEEGEYYLFQIIGARMVTTDGEDLGRIVEVLVTGANDVFIVRGGPYGEVLMPDIPEVILDVDIVKRQVTVKPPPGLLPE